MAAVMRLVGAFPQPAWAVAAEQHGNVTTEQLSAAGASRQQIRRAVERGHLHRVHRGVYAVGRPPVTPHERAMAAVLACGPGALLSHRWALWLWNLHRLPRHAPDVSTRRDRHDRPNLTLHQSRSLTAHDRDTERAIPTTSPARTLIDCTPLLTPAQLRRAVNDAQVRKLTAAEEIRDAIARSPGRPTNALSVHVPPDRHGATRSLLEDLVTDLVREEGWPSPLVNHHVEGRERDFVFPTLGLVIEADGYAFHSTRPAFEDDHVERLALQAAGWHVVAVTYAQLTRGREDTRVRLSAVRAAIGRRRR